MSFQAIFSVGQDGKNFKLMLRYFTILSQNWREHIGSKMQISRSREEKGVDDIFLRCPAPKSPHRRPPPPSFPPSETEMKWVCLFIVVSWGEEEENCLCCRPFVRLKGLGSLSLSLLPPRILHSPSIPTLKSFTCRLRRRRGLFWRLATS